MTNVLRPPLNNEHHLRRPTVANRLGHEQFHRVQCAPSLRSPSQSEDAAPDNFTVARVNSVHLAENRRSDDDLAETKRIARNGAVGHRRGGRSVGPCGESLDEVDDVLWEALYAEIPLALAPSFGETRTWASEI